MAHVLAVWFGCGHVPYAPGTAGTLGAVPLYLALRPWGQLALVPAVIAVTVAGIWASGVVEKRLAVKDPQVVCVDEVAGVLVTLLAAPRAGWPGWVAGVVLFRIFDQVKPFPAGFIQARLPGGWGIVGDDLAAGAWGAGILMVGRALGWL